MEINESLVDKLSAMSKLEFSSDEKKELMGDLQKMLSFVNKLHRLDTQNVEPLLFITSNSNIFRKDEVSPEISREEALLNAQNKDEHFFKVPKVIKKS